MPLCANCHQNEATIHITTVVNGERDETIHLCKNCAPPTGLAHLDLKELEALSVIGKKCEFCGKEAISGVMGVKGGATYWCFDCGLEYGRILSDLCLSERPDLMKRCEPDGAFLSICFDPELRAWSDSANQKAVRILRERRRQDGRDKGG